MCSPEKTSVGVKIRIVLDILEGRSTVAEIADRKNISETVIAGWVEQFVSGVSRAIEPNEPE